MMFVHDKGFRYDMQTLVNFGRKFLVTVWKFNCQFFFGKSVFKDTCRKSFKVFFALAFRFRTAVRRNGNLIDDRLREIGFLKAF